MVGTSLKLQAAEKQSDLVGLDFASLQPYSCMHFCQPCNKANLLVDRIHDVFKIPYNPV